MQNTRKLMIILFTLIIFSLIIFMIFKNPEKSRISNNGLLFVGDTDDEIKPLLLYFNSNNLTFNNLNLTNIILDFVGFHKADSFIVNNQYKIVLGTYKPGKVIILGSNNTIWNNFKFEFSDNLDLRIRALAIGDIDNDRKDEILVGTRPNGILKYYKFINESWKGFLIDQLNKSIHDLAITDFDGLGKNEVFVSASISPDDGKANGTSSSAELIKYEFNNNTWSKETLLNFTYVINKFSDSNPPVPITLYDHSRYIFIDDFEGNGKKEIVTISVPLGHLYEFKRDNIGYSISNIENNLTLSDSIITSGDLFNDGKKEIVISTKLFDSLLMYQFDKGGWKRTVLTKDLIKSADESVVGISIIPSLPAEKYKKVLLVTNSTKLNFYVLEYDDRSNEWNNRFIGGLDTHIHSTWGIYPTFLQ